MKTKGVVSLVSVMMGHQDGERSLELSFAGIEESDAELSVYRGLTLARFLEFVSDRLAQDLSPSAGEKRANFLRQVRSTHVKL